MSDEANIAGVIVAIIAVTALAGPQLTHAQSTARHGTASVSQVASTSSCRVTRTLGAPRPVRVAGSTVATLTQYRGTCNGATRVWATVQFTRATMRRYSTQSSAAIVRSGHAAVGRVHAEATDGATSQPVAAGSACTAATATVRLVRVSDGRSYGPLTATTARHC